jgi:hypothetical protein
MLTALLALAAASSSEPVDLSGIWEGHVGNLPIRACFDPTQPFGAYYYLSRRQLIPLESEAGNRTVFREQVPDSGPQSTWTVDQAAGMALSGRWSRGTRTLPVRLNRVAVRGDLSPCAHIEFHRPRLDGIGISEQADRVDGVPIRRLRLDHRGRFPASVETFRIEQGGAGTELINRALGDTLDGPVPEWFNCLRAPLETGPNEGDFDQKIEPVLISRRWVSVTEQKDLFCGGAYPSSGQVYRLFDRESGTEIDPRIWLGERAFEWRNEEGGAIAYSIRPAFRDLILDGWGREAEECIEPVRQTDQWRVGLTRQGLVFSPELPHVVQACGDDFLIPFDRLGPFLTREGRSALHELENAP